MSSDVSIRSLMDEERDRCSWRGSYKGDNGRCIKGVTQDNEPATRRVGFVENVSYARVYVGALRLKYEYVL